MQEYKVFLFAVVAMVLSYLCMIVGPAVGGVVGVVLLGFGAASMLAIPPLMIMFLF